MKNIRLFELEEAYHEDKANHEYPTVSYTQDTDKVWYMVKETILPNVNINELSTNFVVSEYYVKETMLFQEIYNKFASDEIKDVRIYIKKHNDDDEEMINTLALVAGNGDMISTIDISSEPLYVNYLSQLTSQQNGSGAIELVQLIIIRNNGVYMDTVWLQMNDGKCYSRIPV